MAAQKRKEDKLNYKKKFEGKANPMLSSIFHPKAKKKSSLKIIKQTQFSGEASETAEEGSESLEVQPLPSDFQPDNDSNNPNKSTVSSLFSSTKTSKSNPDQQESSLNNNDNNNPNDSSEISNNSNKNAGNSLENSSTASAKSTKKAGHKYVRVIKKNKKKGKGDLG